MSTQEEGKGSRRDLTFLYVKKTTKELFKKHGRMGETQDHLLRHMINHIEKCDRWYNEY